MLLPVLNPSTILVNYELNNHTYFTSSLAVFYVVVYVGFICAH